MWGNMLAVLKVCLMPKAFLIVSDPVVIRHILADR